MNKKTVLVTGASRGIGRATARLFAANNYNVIINYNNSEEEANELYTELKEKGYSVKTFKADISNRQEANWLVNFCIGEFGKIDVLINNAGVHNSKLFTDFTDEDFDELLGVNLHGMLYTTQKALQYMIPEKSGKIINISSVWGLVGGANEVLYSTSKAAVIGLTKSLAKEVGPSNIHVNCIAPGAIMTDMLSDASEEALDIIKDKTPLMKIGTPEDIANCALFLAGDKSNFITGQVISPNGGFVI